MQNVQVANRPERSPWVRIYVLHIPKETEDGAMHSICKRKEKTDRTVLPEGESMKDDIVYCKDCKYYNEKYGTCENPQWDVSVELPYPVVYDDGYCAWGEEDAE